MPEKIKVVLGKDLIEEYKKGIRERIRVLFLKNANLFEKLHFSWQEIKREDSLPEVHFIISPGLLFTDGITPAINEVVRTYYQKLVLEQLDRNLSEILG